MNKLIIILLCVSLALQSHGQSYRNGHGAFATGKYPDLFKKLGYSDKEVWQKLDSGFNQLFQGDSATQRIYFKVGANRNGPLAYISDVAHNDIRTEGMSYGMMIAVQLNKKDVFNALWNYAMTYMYISSKEHPSNGYFSWSLKRNGEPNDETPAPDGEEYFVTALYFASGRWGNGEGIYNYHAWADKILTNMRHHGIISGMTKFGNRKIGPMVDENKKMIRFVPGIGWAAFTDPSYHLPHFYELWARWGPEEDRDFWYAAADSSRAFFVKAANAQTALTPDYANFDGTAVDMKHNNYATNFSFDSWRTASNWSVDWAWFKKDKNEQVLSDRILQFFASKGIDNYGCVFSVDDEHQFDDRHAAGLIAANAIAGIAGTDNLKYRYAQALWKQAIPHTLVERYYDGLLYLMSLLHCSGNYKIYPPR